MENERLIELVRMNPVLYDHTHPKYSDSHIKEKTWKEIGRELNNSSKFGRSNRSTTLQFLVSTSCHRYS